MKPLQAWIIAISVAIIALVHVINLTMTMKAQHEANEMMKEMRNQ